MTKPKMKPLRVDVHITLSDEQFEKVMKAFDELTEVMFKRDKQ